VTDDRPDGGPAPALFRFWGHIDPRGRTKPPLLASAPDIRTDGSTATLRLYDPIDSYGEFWGVSAKEFASTLDSLPEGTSEIRLHINSPGGEVHEGLAILNALRAHPARVVAVVDGLAASAASFIATGADELVMGRNTELMIHDAWGVAIGPAEDLRQLADRLDSLSANIASIYAEKAGGELAGWREAMRTETWYSAQEAVDAGLADSVLAKPDPEPTAAPAKARWDYSLFAHAGRAAAPAPTTPAAVPAVAAPVDPPPAPVVIPEPAEPVTTPEPAAPVTEPAAPVSTTPAQPAPEPPAEPDPNPTEEDGMAGLKEGLASRLGVEKDVDDDTFLAALDEALNERADVSPAGPAPAGYTLVPVAAWQQAQTAMAAGVKAQTDNVTIERERILADARDKGRILPHKESLASWRDQYDRDPAGTTAYLAKAPQIVPVAALGYAGGAEDEAAQSEQALNVEMANILGVSVEEFSRG
jgi:ATP-dependent Clp endopeptidase proteolytic subunit ClpP